jgi:hypothetical protein
MADTTYNDYDENESGYDVVIDGTEMKLSNSNSTGQTYVSARNGSSGTTAFYGNHTVSWGIVYDEGFEYSTDYAGYISYGKTTIKRNGVDFYTIRGAMQYSLPKAISIIDDLRNDEDIDWFAYNYAEEQIIGRKVVYKGYPAIIKAYYEGTGIVDITYDSTDNIYSERVLEKMLARWGISRGGVVKVNIVEYRHDTSINWYAFDDDEYYDEYYADYVREKDNSTYE